MPCLRVIDIAVIWCDIEIPRNHYPFMDLQLVCYVGSKLFQPVQLVCEFFGTNLGAIDNIQIDKPYVIDSYRQDAALGIIESWHVSDDVSSFFPAQ